MSLSADPTYVDFNSELIRKNAIDKIGLLDEECPSFQEWDTNIRLAIYSNFGVVNEFLVSYFQRSSGRISNDNKRALHGLAYIYSKHKTIWNEIAGKNIFFLKVHSLALQISQEDKVFQNEMLLLLPELKKIPIVYKVKIFFRKIVKLLIDIFRIKRFPFQ